MNTTFKESSTGRRARLQAKPLLPNLGALLDAAVEQFAERPAWIFVESKSKPLTYKDLGALVARSANAFAALGVRKGSHVGVMLPNVPEFLAAWLALARLGARMIPIDPSFTADELRYRLTDGSAEWFLVDGAKAGTFESMQEKGSVLDRSRVISYGQADVQGLRRWSDLLSEAQSSFDAKEDVGLEDVVNIQYTSGSTGLPKGCLLSHRYWLEISNIFSEVWPRFERIQCDLPFYYMGPLWRFVFAAREGAALCVPPNYTLSRFRERVRDCAYDMAWMLDPVAMLPPDPIERDHRLKMIAVFGLSKHLHRPLEQRYGVPVREAYGMTEIGLVTYMPIEDAHMSGSGSCGIASPYHELMVADAAGNPLPPGEVGELFVRGPGILQGYHNKPEATAASFHDDWFRTGDLFKQDEDGYFYIVGRIKEMVRRSGENISVNEVEAALYGLPAMKEVAVHAVKDEKRGEEVKACIILHEGLNLDSVSPAVILAHCREHLAPFKVPRFLQYFASFPRTGSNKVAKKRLADGEGEPLSKMFDASTGAWM